MSRGYSRPSSAGRLLNGPSTSYDTLPAYVQNVKKSKVYVFGDADVQDDEDVVFEMEVRPRKGPKPQSSVADQDDGPAFIERQITEDDTLQSLSLQYGCPVSEIKRINNLIKDQEFFALRTLKIPVKKHSFLIDAHGGEAETVIGHSSKINGAASSLSRTSSVEETAYHSDSESNCNLSDPDTQKLLIRTLSINDSVRSQGKEAKAFLKNMDKDLEKLRNSTRLERDSLDEVIDVLTNKSVQPLVRQNRAKVSGADWGLTFKTVIVALVVLVVLIPLVYLLYLYKSGKL